MQDRKMTNPTDGINETNKKLRQIYEQICCSTSNYNTLGVVSLTSSASIAFDPNQLHSITWELGSGATFRIEDGTNTVTFTGNNSITFPSVNSNLLQFTAIGGTVRIMYITA